jgi:regulator of nucleoside diphosphate kinase
MKNKMTVTVNDYQRLMELVGLASMRTKMPTVTGRLFECLAASNLLPPEKIGRTVITMNSRVRLKNLTNSREAEITLTYPQEADPRKARVTVFSEIGLALLGRQENDVVSWQVPHGVGEFRVEKVIYQPEAAGDYSL